MNQLIFKFPFKTTYYEKDFFVSSNNFEAYKLIESLPNWPEKKINIFGPKGCGKTHLSNVLNKKIDSIYIQASEINNNTLVDLKSSKCIIVDNYNDNIDEKLCEIHIWFKFLKFGFWRPTDQCCYHIWNDRLCRKEAVEIVKEKQYSDRFKKLRVSGN